MVDKKSSKFKRLSQRIKKQSASVYTSLDESVDTDDLKMKKKGKRMSIWRRTISSFSDLYKTTKDSIDGSEKEMLVSTRKAMKESEKIQISEANKALEEAGVSSSERKNVIRKIKEEFENESKTISKRIKKKFGRLRKNVERLSNKKNSAQNAEELEQLVQNDCQTNKLDKNSNVKECIDTITKDLPQEIEESKEACKKTINGLNIENIKIVGTTYIDAKREKNNSVSLVGMKEEFENNIKDCCKKIDAEIKKYNVEEITVRRSEKGMVINGKTHKNFKKLIKTIHQIVSAQEQNINQLYKNLTNEGISPAVEFAVELMKKSGKFTEADISKYQKDVGEGVEELQSAISGMGQGLRKSMDNAPDLYNNDKKSVDEDFKKYIRGEELKDSSLVNIYINLISNLNKYTKTALEEKIPSIIEKSMEKIKTCFLKLVNEKIKKNK